VQTIGGATAPEPSSVTKPIETRRAFNTGPAAARAGADLEIAAAYAFLRELHLREYGELPPQAKRLPRLYRQSASLMPDPDLPRLHWIRRRRASDSSARDPWFRHLRPPGAPALFGSFVATMARSDLTSAHHRMRLLAFPMRTRRGHDRR
jgi:hypothetical protein